MLNLTQEDKDVISWQIGREPQGIAKIAVRAKNGTPLVLQMQSIVDEKPFPTLYWLCSRDLSKAIGSIETSGWVKKIEEEILIDSDLKQAFYENHQAYVRERSEQMTAQDRLTIEQRGFSEMFERYGIGGISQWDKVRCLHMQYAHHLAQGNAIGKRMDEEFELYKLLDKADLK